MRWPFCVYRENYRLFFGFTAALTTGREWSYSCRMASVMWPPHALSPAVGDASMFQAVKREAALPVDDPSDMARRINPCQALSSADLLGGGRLCDDQAPLFRVDRRGPAMGAHPLFPVRLKPAGGVAQFLRPLRDGVAGNACLMLQAMASLAALIARGCAHETCVTLCLPRNTPLGSEPQRCGVAGGIPLSRKGACMKLVISGTLLLALVVSAPTKAQQQPVQTGLGECVDFMIYGSSTLTNQVNTAPYTFVYSSSSWIDKDNKVVYVMNYTCSPTNLHGLYGAVGQVSHEMGHAFFDAPASLAGPKGAFVKRMCTDEGVLS